MSKSSRLPLLNRTDLPEEFKVYLSDEYRGEPNFFRVLANNPPLLEALFEYSAALSKGLSSTEREIATLAASHENQSQYVWHQHVGRTLGDELALEEIQAIGNGDLSPFDGRTTALIQYARAFSNDAMTDEIHESLTTYYSNNQIVEIALLLGFYIGLHSFMDAVNIPLEEEFISWTPKID